METDSNPVKEQQHGTTEDAEIQPESSKRRRTINVRLEGYHTEGPSKQSNYRTMEPASTSLTLAVDQRSSLLTMYLHILDNFVGEIDNRFGTLQSDIAAAVSATHPGSPSFLSKSALQPLAELANMTLDDTELDIARRFFAKYCDSKAIAQSSVISSMPTVQRIIQLSRTIAVSTAACESSFSTLKRVLTPHRMSMLHNRKADLILISCEREVASNIRSDGHAASPPDMEFRARRPSATAVVLAFVLENCNDCEF